MDNRDMSLSPNPASEMQIHDSFAAALRDRQFFICLQPKFALPDRRIVGAEALLRWNDPEEGILFPAEFLPAAQRVGYLEALDLFAIEEACRCIQGWINEHAPVVRLSINISAASLYATGFCDAALDCLSRYDIPPSSIEFEFSAQFAQLHADKLSDMIECMQRAGLSCCIDGFSDDVQHIEHLSAFGVNTVKFNCRNYPGKQQEACVDAFTQAYSRAKELHIGMLCEGVERPQQMDALMAAGCEMMQGYALSMPVSAGLFSQMLRKHG